jgi:hypothetical protein
VATRRTWACQRTVPMRHGAGELEARRAACGVSKEGGNRCLQRRHHGGAAALTAVDQRRRATRHLSGNVPCQWFAGEAAGEGMRWHLTEAWMEHHGMGVAGISPVGSVARSRHRREAVMGRHGAPQPTQRLKVAGGHAIIFVAWGGDWWTACQWEFGRR